MLAVYKKELRQAFTSIFGYVFLAFLLALVGFYVYTLNLKGDVELADLMDLAPCATGKARINGKD